MVDTSDMRDVQCSLYVMLYNIILFYCSDPVGNSLSFV